MKKLLFVIIFLCWTTILNAETYKITAYCPGEKCNSSKWKGISATGHKLDVGIAACNTLPLYSIIYIESLGYKIIMDRGSQKYFSKQKHIDVLMPTHKEALKFGVKYLDVKIIK